MDHLLVDGMQYHQSKTELSGTLKICVIGGGAAGLAAVKVIKESDQFRDGKWDVVAYESRQDIGGVWYAYRFLSSYLYHHYPLGFLLLQ